MNPRLLCIVKIKVTGWQLRDNQWNDEWPCLLVKVGRRSHGVNGSLLSECSLICEVWVERLTSLITEALQMSDLGREQKHPYLCTHAHAHTQTCFCTVQPSLFIPAAALCPSWLPPIGTCLTANWALELMTQHTETLLCSTCPLTYSQTHSINVECAHTLRHTHTRTYSRTPFGSLKKHQSYSISCCLSSRALITAYTVNTADR